MEWPGVGVQTGMTRAVVECHRLIAGHESDFRFWEQLVGAFSSVAPRISAGASSIGALGP